MFPRWVWDVIRYNGDVYAEVRGWSSDVVEGRYTARPSISEISSPCPTKRDVYLRRVAGLRIESEGMRIGRIVHEVFLEVIRSGGIDRGLREFERLARGYGISGNMYRFLRSIALKAGVLAEVAAEEGIPIVVEPRIPGSLIGLSDFVKPDVLVSSIPVDLVLANGCGWADRKEIALAGYALAVEAWMGVPVNTAIAIAVSQSNGSARFQWKVFRVDDVSRRRFLELRDRVARIIEYGEDPGASDQCPSECPFVGVCHGKGDSGSRAGLKDKS